MPVVCAMGKVFEMIVELVGGKGLVSNRQRRGTQHALIAKELLTGLKHLMSVDIACQKMTPHAMCARPLLSLQV